METRQPMETRKKKKTYETPGLTVWGSLRDLTQSYFGDLDFKQGTTPGNGVPT